MWISENKYYSREEDVQKLTEKYTAEIEELGKLKEQEIMEV